MTHPATAAHAKKLRESCMGGRGSQCASSPNTSASQDDKEPAPMYSPRTAVAQGTRRAATMVSTGSLCCPCTTRGPSSHARLLPEASSSPEGRVTIQLKSTMWCSIGGCGFRATYLTPVGLLAARFCSRPGSVIHIAPDTRFFTPSCISARRAGCGDIHPPSDRTSSDVVGERYVDNEINFQHDDNFCDLKKLDSLDGNHVIAMIDEEHTSDAF
jgi:hypothetical protein